MATTQISSLNRAVQDTQEWLKELADTSAFENETQAYSGLRAVLHSLRDRLTVEEAAHFSAQLPMLVRGIYFEGWRPALAPNAEETREEFYASVRESLRNASLDVDPAEATRETFALLERKVDPGQIRHVKEQMPQDVKGLWA